MGPYFITLLTPSELEPRDECTAPNCEDTVEDFRGIGNYVTLIWIDRGQVHY